MKASIQNAFPVPHLLIPSRMAVEVSDGSLRFFESARTQGALYPKRFGTIAFPRLRLSALTDKAKEEAIAALSSFRTANNVKAVKVIVHEGEAYVFRMTVPTVHAREVRAAIEAGLEENVPIAPSEAVFEYTVIRVDLVRVQTIVAVTVLSQKSLDAYVDIFSEAGLSIVAFETEARALARSLFTPTDTAVHAVLAIKSHHSTVFIVENGAISFSSSIEVGSADMDAAIAKTFNITPAAAQAMKLAKGFAPDKDDMPLFESMIPVFSTIRDELDKVFAYWRTQNKKEEFSKDIADIVLAGGDSLISGFSQYLTLSSRVEAKQGSVWTRTISPEKALPQLSYRESLDYGAVIGALL
jgi:Tfp pilus assembly PilM family ATPase